jgi:hypothetical protein
MLRIRESAFADAESIRLLNDRNAMGHAGVAAWRENWEAHPFRAEFQGIPIGWVLEADGSVVGNLDNIHMLYRLGSKPIKAVVAAGWVVDKEHRGKALQLMTTFFRQKGVDLCLNVSATPSVAQVLTAMKIGRIPIPGYATPCFWAVRPRAFARAALGRRSIPAAGLAAYPAGLALLARDIFLQSGRGRIFSKVRQLDGLDDRFDGLWERIGAGPACLRAVRTRAALEWRFRTELRDGRAAIVVAESGATLDGYAILVRRDDPDLGMSLFEVADLQAAGDNSSTLRDLLLGSVKVAREEGADAVKFVTGTPSKRAPVDALRPYSYRLPFCSSISRRRRKWRENCRRPMPGTFRGSIFFRYPLHYCRGSISSVREAPPAAFRGSAPTRCGGHRRRRRAPDCAPESPGASESS